MAVTVILFDVGETLVDETRAWERIADVERVAVEAGRPAGELAYVGDRVDNDVLPAKRGGMFTVHVRRGPWGVLHDSSEADARIESLEETAAVVA